MKCPKTQIEVTADDCEQCVSDRVCYEWCIEHIVWGVIGEPRFTHEMGKYGEGLGQLLSERRKMRKRTITIESPPENTLSVKVEADLVDEFVRSVTRKGGVWRSKSKKETFGRALESAVAAALALFLEDLKGDKHFKHEYVEDTEATP